MTCPNCQEELPEENVFCEACGKRLTPAPPAPLCLCGAPDEELDSDGFCLSCGKRCRPAREDHVEIEISPEFAGVSDRGKQHSRNEDRVRLRGGAERAIVVVCDGVSNSSNSDAAAAVASETAAEILAAGGSLKEAIQAAAQQVKDLALSKMEVCPSTTIVLATASKGQIELAWLGDSRAYWVGEAGGAQQLTRDHSWMNDVVTAGEMSVEEAGQSPMAHGITRWLGADARDIEAETAEFKIPGAGWLLVCTDGLWNYAPDKDELGKLVAGYAAEDPGALSIARKLVEFANGRGGRDNVTAALVRIHG